MLAVFSSALALFVGYALFLVATVTSFLTGLASQILQWVISDGFISLSYTNAGLSQGATNFNQFVSVGWELTRGLTNIIFVIALVAIGLMTALGAGGEAFKAKKALPLLVVIALLINFTPIILGLIIDASNILMSFFLQGVGGFDFFAKLMSNSWEEVKTATNKFFDPVAAPALVINMAVRIFVGLAASLVFLVFAALFAVRYIALWVLVILSPLAFAFYILPQTRKYWSQWWEQFLQWSFIGITGAFFLYLSSKMIEMMGPVGDSGATRFWRTTETSALTGDWSGLMTTVLPWGIIIIFMIIGLMMSFQTGAMGASQIVGFTQKHGKNLGRFMGGIARRTPGLDKGGWAEKIGEKGKAGKLLAGTMRATGFTGGFQQAEKTARERMEKIPALGRMVGGPGAFASGLDADRKMAGKRLETMTPDEIRNVMRMPSVTRGDKLRQARGFELLVEKGWQKEEDKKYLKNAVASGVHTDPLYDKMPHWAPNIREQVEGMDVEEFRKNVSANAFETKTPPAPGSPPGTPPTRSYSNEQLDVFYSMDLRKAIDLGEKGKREQKEALRNLIMDREPAISAKITALRATGRTEDTREADKTGDMWAHIANSPNFVV